jgi:Uma2 family endonuclease
MAQASPARALTVQEYLDLERAADFRSEFFDGEMFAMAGGTITHSGVSVNLTLALGTALKRAGNCRLFDKDLRIKIEATGLFTYPDLSVVCGKPVAAEDDENSVVNPSLLAEVLSDSTEGYDRGRKFEHYRQIPTLREYLLVNQHEPRLELFIRQADDSWILRVAKGLEATLPFPGLGVAIRLADVYADVDFPRVPLHAV